MADKKTITIELEAFRATCNSPGTKPAKRQESASALPGRLAPGVAPR
jgi:hypothetical protein